MRKYRIPALCIPALLCMLMIFLFSAQTAEVSSGTSGGLIEYALEKLSPSFDHLSPSEKKLCIDALQFIVRKGAHFSVYALLGFLCSLPCSQLFSTTFRSAAAACAVSILYAVTDELHQYFVPGRSCEVRDVLIDAAGACTGVLLFFLFRCISATMKRKKRKRQR